MLAVEITNGGHLISRRHGMSLFQDFGQLDERLSGFDESRPEFVGSAELLQYI
jgi:hypothetical protein